MKKKCIAIGLMLFFVISVNAQVKTAFYLYDEITLDSTMATSFAVYGKLTGQELYTYKRYDIYNNLMTAGTFKDEQLKIPHGKFTNYLLIEDFNEIYAYEYLSIEKEIFVYEEGHYEDGLSVGRWNTYYPDGKLLAVVNFNKGLRHGEYIEYNPKGDVVTFGKFVNDKKEGEWFFKKGRKKVVYVNDIEQKKIK